MNESWIPGLTPMEIKISATPITDQINISGYEFSPQSDISAYESTLIMKYIFILANSGYQSNSSVNDFLQKNILSKPELARHWKKQQ